MPNPRLYNSGLLKILNGDINYLTDTIQVLLVDDNYTFSKSHTALTDVDGDEVTNDVGTGYERKTLGTKSISLNSTDDRVEYKAADVIYTEIETNEQLAAAIVYKGTDLIAFLEFDPKTTNGSDVRLNLATSDVIHINNDLS
jgi:hypothetical protein